MDAPVTTPHPVLAPVPPAERIELLDIFRGFALLGVLIANMRGFNGPLAAYFDHSLMWQDTVSRATQSVINVLVSGKFITIFSLLFGAGVAIQLDRAASRPAGFLLRRFGFLMALGLAHIYLLWWGDILFTYSVFGFALILFRNRAPRTLLWWSAALYVWPVVMFGSIVAVAALGNPMPAPPSLTPAELTRVIELYGSGSYLEILPARIKETNTALSFVPFFGPHLLGIFLFGLWLWRKGILHGLSGQTELLRRCQRWGLLVGLPLSLTAEALKSATNLSPGAPSPAALLYLVINSVSIPALSLLYLATIARAVSHPALHAALLRFAPVGRMALTNYLTQTVVCILLFHGYGLGLFGRVAPLAGLAGLSCAHRLAVCQVLAGKGDAAGPGVYT
jgi:uncharacterized protein